MAARSPSAEAVSEEHREAGRGGCGCDGAWAGGWCGVCEGGGGGGGGAAVLVLTMADTRGGQGSPADGSPAGEVDSRLPMVSAAAMLLVVEVVVEVAGLAGSSSLLVDMMTDVVLVEDVLGLEVDVVDED